MYFLAVDTCAHMKNVTGGDLEIECKSQAESLAILSSVYIQNKIGT